MRKEGRWWRRRLRGWFLAPIVVSMLPSAATVADAQMQVGPTDLTALQYRFIGPPGNRVIAVVGVPGDLKTYYVGAASGGVWKSVDGGTNWKSMFDKQTAQSIGSLAIAPSDPSIVWAGTGETFIRSNISSGNGIYKSTDSGVTWTNMGLEKTGRIGRIVINPRDPNIVFAAAMGHSYGPQPDRGVFRTMDGGKTWEKVLFVDENTGASDIAMDPNNSQILVAGTWQMEIKTWGKFSGGPGSGIFMSRDGGTTWKRLGGHGLPDSPLGKIGVAIAPSDSNRMYALIETGGRGTLWRSDDGGGMWKVVSYNRELNSRPHYTTRVTVSPIAANEIYISADSLSVSFDGGEMTEVVMGGDHHDLWFDPTNADRIMTGNDGGAQISINHGVNWHRVVLPIAQMYHVHLDNRIPYYVYGARQDGPPYRGPSNSRSGGTIPSHLWIRGPGNESGMVVPDPVDPNIVWGGGQAAILEVWDARTQHARSVRVWPKSPRGWPAGLLRYRFNWTFPIAISPHDHNKLYVGSQHVHQTTDGGQSWKEISPDLSTGDKSRLGVSGGLTPDNLSPEYGSVVFAIAESPIEKGLIWAGTNDGLIQVTRDGGGQWTNVTANIPDLPPLGTVSNIEPSRYDAGTAYIALDFHQVNNRDPFVYKTTDYGKTWKSISSDVPKGVLSYTHCVREDPVRKGLLYLGTENALYVSFDDGGHWAPLQNNLPHAPVRWIAVQPTFNDVVVATYGRGFWILDDITPLQQMTPKILESDAHLFTPRPAYRFAAVTDIQDSPNDQAVGQNPPYGASINYYLKSEPKGDVSITIEDESGHTVRTLSGMKGRGLNRVWWDLRQTSFREARLRTTPPGDPHIWEDKEFREARTRGWYPLVSYNADRSGKFGPGVVPGTYTVKLTVGGQSFTNKLVVKKDPNSTGTEADIRAQVKTALDIRESLNTVVDSINQIEWIRKQFEDLIAMLEERPADQALKRATIELDKKLYAVEGKFFQVILAESDTKHYRAPQKLYSQLIHLNADVQSADFRPTDQQLEVFEELQKELATFTLELKQLLQQELPAFNRMLLDKNLRGIVVPTTL